MQIILLRLLITQLYSMGSLNQTLTLPTAVGIPGRVYVVKYLDSASNTHTIDPNGSETIDGALTDTLSGTGSMMIQSDGTGWIILAEY